MATQHATVPSTLALSTHPHLTTAIKSGTYLEHRDPLFAKGASMLN